MKERQACGEPWTEFPLGDVEFEMATGHSRGRGGSMGTVDSGERLKWAGGVGVAGMCASSMVWCGDEGALRGCSYGEIRETATSVAGERRLRRAARNHKERSGDQLFQMHQRGQVRESHRWERGPGIWQVLGEAALVEGLYLDGRLGNLKGD